ncbi:MAG: YlbF family regulator [Akkermansiaceae bacterium]
MTALTTDSDVIVKTRELCETISQDLEFLTLQGQVERFLGDDGAKLQYQSVHELGEQLHQKQQASVELSELEIKQFEEAREALMNNEVASDFMAAQQSLQTLQKTITKYISMTLELGRVPEAEDMQDSNGGGCCGGGCGC